MRRKVLSPMPNDHINVTPLIDVIMCLIIFFLLCGKFAKDETSARVKIPQSELGQTMTDQQGRLVINVVPPEVGETPDLVIRTTTVKPGDLLAVLTKEKRANPEVKVIIRADKDLAYTYISPVLVACAQANIQNVDFAIQTEGAR